MKLKVLLLALAINLNGVVVSAKSASDLYGTLGVASVKSASSSYTVNSKNYTALLGYNLNSWLAVEAEVSRPFEDYKLSLPAGHTNKWNSSHNAVMLKAQAKLADSAPVLIHGRFGKAQFNWKEENTSTSPSTNTKYNEQGFIYGIGVRLFLFENVSSRFDFTKFVPDNEAGSMTETNMFTIIPIILSF